MPASCSGARTGWNAGRGEVTHIPPQRAAGYAWATPYAMLWRRSRASCAHCSGSISERVTRSPGTDPARRRPRHGAAASLAARPAPRLIVRRQRNPQIESIAPAPHAVAPCAQRVFRAAAHVVPRARHHCATSVWPSAASTMSRKTWLTQLVPEGRKRSCRDVAASLATSATRMPAPASGNERTSAARRARGQRRMIGGVGQQREMIVHDGQDLRMARQHLASARARFAQAASGGVVRAA